MDKQALPVKWSYIFGGGLIGLGLLLLSVALGQAVRTATSGLKTMSLPGQQRLALKEPGLYTGLSMHSPGAPLPAQDAARLEIFLADADTGAPVPFQRAPGAAMVKMGPRTGLLLFQALVERPGDYVLSARYAGGAAGPALDAVLVHESLARTRGDVAVGAILFLTLAGFGLYILIAARRRAKASAPPPPAPKKKK